MPRKKNQNPQVHTKQTKSGSYSYFFEGITVAGKRNQIIKGGFRTQDEALSAGKKALEEYYGESKADTDDNTAADISFEDFVTDIWFPQQSKAKNWLPSTRQSYMKQLRNYAFPKIGGLIMRNITTPQLQDMLDDLYYNKHRSRASVSNFHSLIYSIFKYAREHGYTKRFYSDEFIVPKADEDSDDADRHSQKRDIIPSNKIDAIFERFPEGSSAFLPMAISLYTGARLGEACALAVEDCDFEKKQIHIRRQFPDGFRGEICKPKYNSVRVVPMCPTLEAILKRAAKKRLKNKKIWGDNYIRTYLTKTPDVDGYRNLHGFYGIAYDGGGKEIHFLNVNEYGKIIYPSVMKHASRIIHGFSSDPKKKKIKGKPIYADYNTHSFRHTFASHLKRQGVSDIAISAVLGHKKTLADSASKTTSKYIHLTEDVYSEMVPVIEKIYKYKTKNAPESSK